MTARQIVSLVAALAFTAGCRARTPETRIVIVTATPAPIAAVPIEPTPEATAAPTPPDETAVFSVPLATTPTSQAETAPSACVEQMAAVLAVAEPLIEEFKDERETALSTPRLSLAAQITRLQDVYRKTKGLREWPNSECGYRFREKLLDAEQNDIDRLSDFLDYRQTYARSGLWRDVNKELAEMQSLVVATGARR